MKTTRYRFEQAVQEANASTIDWLKGEFKDILESDKDYTAKTDYLGYSIISIDTKIATLDDQIKELQTLKKNLKVAKTVTLQIGAEVFSSYNIKRLEGAGISSITIDNPTPTSKAQLTIHNEYKLIEAGFYRKVLDEDAILEFYNSGKCLDTINECCTIEIVKDVKPSKLKVNKRRGAVNNSTDEILGVAS